MNHAMDCSSVGSPGRGAPCLLYSTGPEVAPEPHFDLAVEAPVRASVEGKARLSNNLSFSDQNLFVHPLQGLDKTVTIVQLSGTSEASVVHDLSLMRLADEPLSSGIYEVGLETACDGPCGAGIVPDELFTASYGRRTVDSLHFYPLETGTVTVETATDEVVEGTFRLEAMAEASVSRADMEAFHDSIHASPPGDVTNLPRPPRPTLTTLAPPMAIEGRFTATAGMLSTEITRPQWVLSGGP